MDTIVFAGGGTGGHIFPGLAIAEFLEKKHPELRCVWLGSSRGLDRGIVESAGLTFYGIPSGKLRRYFSVHNVLDLFRIGAGFFVSLYRLWRLRPRLVFSKGGFVSVPPCFAAFLLRIPVITHECDFTPGLATRLNSRVAKMILVSYEETAAYFPEKYRSRIRYTGNPVRSEFYAGDPDAGRSYTGCTDPEVPVVFVQGGSLGARQINELLCEIARELCGRCFVVHQTGAGNRNDCELLEREIPGSRYRSFEFIRGEMPHVLASADIVVSRAGANSVWECATAGKPMVLIPLDTGSSRGDQIDNARYFENRGAAVVLAGEKATAVNLLNTVRAILDDSARLAAMAAASKSLGSHQAAEIIARYIAEFNPEGTV